MFENRLSFIQPCRICAVLSFLLASTFAALAQHPPSLNPADTAGVHFTAPRHDESFAFPASLVAYGALAMKIGQLKQLDKDIKEEVWTDLKHKPCHIDNYAQYAPGLSVFALQAAGLRGAHNARDEAMLYLLSNTIMAAIVNPLKYATHVRRPDGFGRNAFPSGHTATAFAGAEFLHQEYGDQSAWYSFAGYSVATGVGFMRIYNNRHWGRDVIAGAGIGMLSTRLAYLLWPKIDRMLFNRPGTAAVTM